MKTALLVVFFGTMVAAAEDPYSTGSLQNGRAWNTVFSDGMKAGYLLAFREGDALLEFGLTAKVSDGSATITVLHNGEPVEFTGFLPKGMTLGEIRDAIDLFFKEPTNAPIPIAYAILYVKRKAEGESEASLKEFETKLRRGAASTEQPKK